MKDNKKIDKVVDGVESVSFIFAFLRTLVIHLIVIGLISLASVYFLSENKEKAQLNLMSISIIAILCVIEILLIIMVLRNFAQSRRIQKAQIYGESVVTSQYKIIKTSSTFRKIVDFLFYGVAALNTKAYKVELSYNGKQNAISIYCFNKPIKQENSNELPIKIYKDKLYLDLEKLNVYSKL